MKEELKPWASCLFWIIATLLLYMGCSWYTSHQNYAYNERLRKDSIRKAFIKDSLEHDPHYQDSVRNARARLRALETEMEMKIAGVMLEGDIVYHTAFHDSLSIEDVGRILFVTNKYVEDNDLDQCDVCRNNNLEIRVDDGDYISKEDADDYCSHNGW